MAVLTPSWRNACPWRRASSCGTGSENPASRADPYTMFIGVGELLVRESLASAWIMFVPLAGQVAAACGVTSAEERSARRCGGAGAYKGKAFPFRGLSRFLLMISSNYPNDESQSAGEPLMAREIIKLKKIKDLAPRCRACIHPDRFLMRWVILLYK